MSTLKPLTPLYDVAENLSLGTDLFREVETLLGVGEEQSIALSEPVIHCSDPNLLVFDGTFTKGHFNSRPVRGVLFDTGDSRHCLLAWNSPETDFTKLVAGYLPDAENTEKATDLIDLYCHGLQFAATGTENKTNEFLYSSLELTDDLRAFLKPHLQQSSLLDGTVRRGLNCTLEIAPYTYAEEDLAELSEEEKKNLPEPPPITETLQPFLAELLGKDPAELIPTPLRQFRGVFYQKEELIRFALEPGISGSWSAGPVSLQNMGLGPDFPLVADALYPEVFARGTVALQSSADHPFVPNGQFSFRGSLDPYWRSFGLQLKLANNQLPPNQLPFREESGWQTLFNLIPLRSVEMGIYGSLTDKTIYALDWKIQGETFHLLDDRLRITPSFEIGIRNPFEAADRQIEAKLEGLAEIGSDLKLACWVTYPFPELNLELTEPVTSSALVQLFFEDVSLPGPLHVELRELRMSYAIESKDFSFRTKVGSEHWKYQIGDFEMALTDLELYVEKEEEHTAYGLRANARLQDTNLYLSGDYRKGAGWILRTFTSGEIVLNDWLRDLSRGSIVLPNSLRELTIASLSFQYETGTKFLEASARFRDLIHWEIGDSGISLKLDELRFSLEKREQTKAELFAKTVIGLEAKDKAKAEVIQFSLRIAYESAPKALPAGYGKKGENVNSKWVLEGKLQGDNPEKPDEVELGKVMNWLQQKSGLEVVEPSGLTKTTLQDVFLKADTSDGSFEIGGKCGFEIDKDLQGVIDLSFRLQNATDKEGKKNGKEIRTHGILKLKKNGQEHRFALHFTSDPDSKYFFAQYQGHLTLQMVVALFDEKAAKDIPAWLSPALDEVFFLLYKSSDKDQNQKWKLLSVVDINLTGEDGGIDLSKVDFIGKYIPPDKSRLKIELNFSYASAEIAKANVKGLNEKLTEFGSAFQLKDEERKAGLRIDPGITAPIFGLDPATDKPPVGEKDESGADAPKTDWKPVRKQLGPVFIDKVGVTMEHGRIKLLLDAGMDVGGFNFKMLDFSISVPMKPKIDSLLDLEFGLNGLELNYTKGELTIAGGFYKQQLQLDTPKIKGDFTGYTGEVRVKFGPKSLSALGGYVSLDGTPSFFLYVVAEVPLGGPPEYFIEGLAGGFGINSSVQFPPVEQVRDFIMVKSAMGEPYFEGDDQSSNLSRAFTDFPPMPGSYWIAIGVKATTYKFVESFLLGIITFGDRLEIHVLGIARVKLPKAAQKMAKAEIQLHAQLIPEEGVLKVDGKITEGSYLFNPMAKLSGGFAFYSWFTDQYKKDENGVEKLVVSAGDFVMTLGGYSPYYKKPAHYPSVDRLSLTYKISEDLYVKASAYFALTPRHFMIGGKLEGVFRTSLVRANLTIEAHFLVNFEPFAYYMKAGIRLRGSVWALWWHSFSIGASVQVWGPDFGGIAVIDLGFFDFKIKFGKPWQPALPINWTKFRDTLLPPEKEINKIFISEGIILENKNGPWSEDHVHYLVNPLDLEIRLESIIPAQAWKGNDASEQDKVSDWQIGIAPMNLTPKYFQPKISYRLERFERNVESDGWLPEEDVRIEPLRRAVPAGLWGTYNQQNLNGKALIGTDPATAPISGLVITPVEPKPRVLVPDPKSENPLSIKELLQPNVTAYPIENTPPAAIEQEAEEQTGQIFSDYLIADAAQENQQTLSSIPGLEYLADIHNVQSFGEGMSDSEQETLLNQYEDKPFVGTLGSRNKLVVPKDKIPEETEAIVS